MEEPQRFDWPIRFGRLIEALTNVGADEEINWLKLTEYEDEADNSDSFSDCLFCDCTSMNINNKFGETIVVVPLHQLASIGLIPSLNILTLKIGDVNICSDLFDLLIIYTPNEFISKQICQHFVDCFQFIYREAISDIEKEGEEEKVFLLTQEKNAELEEKFIPLSSSLISSTSSTNSLSSFPISSNNNNFIIQQKQLNTNNSKINYLKNKEEEYFLNNFMTTNITNSSSSTTTTCSNNNICEGYYVNLVDEYLNNLSECLSHDELRKFAVLIHRWRASEIPIIEFAQKLLELYGPERKHLLAKMRSLLRGDPSEIEVLGNFLRANGVIENDEERFL